MFKSVEIYSKELINININNTTNYKLSEFVELLNVSVKILQRWDRDYVLIVKRTPTNRRDYTYD
ncbi:MAG: MerR family transcriptional regulator [Sarcina sp.]